MSLNDLPFLFQKMRIDKQEKLVCSLIDKCVNVLHVRNSKQVLSHSLLHEKVHQEVGFQPNIEMNSGLLKNAHRKKMILKNIFQNNEQLGV